jgi:hypothetical protein
MYNSFPVILLISSYPTHFPFACIGCDIVCGIVCGMGRGYCAWLLSTKLSSIKFYGIYKVFSLHHQNTNQQSIKERMYIN